MLLVELRKEFQMRGIEPATLPETFNAPETILGTHSPLEAIDLYSPYTSDLDDLKQSTLMCACRFFAFLHLFIFCILVFVRIYSASRAARQTHRG